MWINALNTAYTATTNPRNWFEKRAESGERMKHFAGIEAATMANRGEVDGWYVALGSAKWTIGRETRNETHHCPVLVDGEPTLFDSMLTTLIDRSATKSRH